MNENLNEVVLRPRFKIELNRSHTSVLEAFEAKRLDQKQFIVSRVDDHVFIKLPKAQQQFWSPQLHLEINALENNKSQLYGLFGPNPTVWTLFMFLHFLVAGLFIAFCIWAYSNYALKVDYQLQVWGIVGMIILWFLLYFSGRLSKTSNQKEMTALYTFMSSVLDE
ncbi:GTP-binding protein [Olleya marilimosa]|uniref:GTP-binding protein n=1 Tax=Olleya marilimosa TaxID=272164 RepID=A0ABR8LXM1_9FLAO|nr:GTP-binding protein [Olleya marilimosa]MBD3864391.1 GTP-binding protein [Olleya marilimosa]MBD3891706.1 GTP-binding protein [Olleya marilimosa]